MKLEVTELGPVQRAVKIEVPAEDVTKRFEVAYADLNRRVHIPGFRPGKAPQGLLEQRYAKAIEEDVLRQLLPDYYRRAMKETGFDPVTVDIPPLERIKIRKGTPLVFTATVEIKPIFELREYKGLTLKQDKRSIDNEELAKAMQILRQQHAQLEVVKEERGIAEGDYVQARIEAFEGAVPSEVMKPENQLLRIGDKAPIVGLVLDDALLGKTKGQVVEVKQPDGGGAVDKTITLRATVQELKAKVLPELDDEFAKDLGDYKTLGELQDKVKTQLEQGLQRDIEEKYKDEIMKRLVDLHHHFELPESLVQRELDAMIQNAHQRRRMTWAEAHGEPERMPPEEVRKLREEFLPTAKERVRLGLVLEAIAQKETIAVAETDIEQECRLMARAMKVEPAEIKKLLLSGGQDAVEDLRSRILADKALQFVYQKAIIQM
ncbi:MAG: trigger factor [Nitrospirota bacterium]